MKGVAVLGGLIIALVIVMNAVLPAYAGPLQFARIVSKTSHWKKGTSMRFTAYVRASYYVTSGHGSFTLQCTIRDQLGSNSIWATLGFVNGTATSNQENVAVHFRTSSVTATLNGGGTHYVFGVCLLSLGPSTVIFNTSTDTVQV